MVGNIFSNWAWVYIATQKKAHENVIVSISYGIKAALASFGSTSVPTNKIIIKRELNHSE